LKCRHGSSGFILLEAMLAAFILAVIIIPLFSTLISVHRNTVWADDNMQILMVGQGQMEELLAAGTHAWINEDFRPSPTHLAYEFAVKVKHLQAGLYKIQVFIRRRDLPNSKTQELATLATSTRRFWP
jgi:hypothetical protein